MADANEVKIVGIGKIPRSWLLAGGAAVAGIVVYAYIRRSRVAPELEPGSEEQLDAAGYVPSDWSPDAFVGATTPGGAAYDPQVDRLDVTTNAEWSQRVIDLLTDVGYDRTKAATTIGKYLSGQPLDGVEKLIVQTAIAMLGNPPAGALPIISLPSAYPTTPSTPTTAPPPPSLAVRPAIGKGSGRYVATWGSVPGATGYQFRWVVRHVGGTVLSFPATKHSHETSKPPTTGHLAFEIRTVKGSSRSQWNRVTIRTN
jgi:hypothetical protein